MCEFEAIFSTSCPSVSSPVTQSFYTFHMEYRTKTFYGEAAAVRTIVHIPSSFISPTRAPIISAHWVPKSTRWEEIAPRGALVFYLPLDNSTVIATTAIIATSNATTFITGATAAAILVLFIEH